MNRGPIRLPSLPHIAGAALLGAVLVLLVPARASAQVTEAPKPEIFPDPAKFSYGLYTQGELGAVVMVGPLGPHLRPGWALGLAAGYDIARWLAVEARGVGSSHLTRFPGSPLDGELLQLYQLMGLVKLSLRWRHLALSADGGICLAHTSTNVLATAGLDDRRTSIGAGGGLGFDYHTLSRHFSFGVRANLFALAQIAKSQAITATATLRYAF